MLVLAVPDRFKEPDDWVYYYATENLSHGRLTVDNTLHKQQVAEANQQSGQLGQYVQIGANSWALEKAPGYVFFLVPFYSVGIPQLANIVLAAGLALVTYRLLKHLKDAKTACVGVFLVLFTPVGLAMMQREYMDGFASAAFLGMGGGLYIYYCLRADTIKPRFAMITLFLAGLFLAVAVAARYTNATVAAVFAIHFLITRIQLVRQSKWSRVWREGLSLGVGATIPIFLLLWYQNVVFGSPLAYGYEYTKGNVKFAYEYLGDPRFWQIVGTNLRQLFWPLLVGFPLLLLAVPAAAIVSWQKTISAFSWLKRHNRGDWWLEMTPSLLILLLGWLVAVFGLYIMYEWTANQGMADRPFIIVTRFYLPALFPLVVFAALLLGKIPGKLTVGLIAIAVISGSLLFAQSSMGILKASPPRPPAQTQPLRQLSPTELARLIDQTRLEVKAAPTAQANLQRRMDVLIRWIGELNRQGYPVGQVMPAAEVNHIQTLILQGKIAQACTSVDAAYAKLEQFVAEP